MRKHLYKTRVHTRAYICTRSVQLRACPGKPKNKFSVCVCYTREGGERKAREKKKEGEERTEIPAEILSDLDRGVSEISRGREKGREREIDSMFGDVLCLGIDLRMYTHT